jgi:hypothetical protein
MRKSSAPGVASGSTCASTGSGRRASWRSVYDLPGLEPGRFDVTFFLGIFYHLPDPISALRLAADLTDELLILNTATQSEHPDGALVATRESSTRPMSGAYGLCWLPTGPEVLTRILNWLGFPEVRCSVWRTPPKQRGHLDRIEMLAARSEGFFDAYDAAAPEGPERVRELVQTRTAPRSTVLVLSDGGEEPVEFNSRKGVRFAPAQADSSDDGAAIAELERLREAGAAYLVARPASGLFRARRSKLSARAGRPGVQDPHAEPRSEGVRGRRRWG